MVEGAGVLTVEQLNTVFAEQQQGLRRWARRLLNDHQEEVEDALQQTYLQAFKNYHTYHGPAPVVAWLRSILYNTAMTVLRVYVRTHPQGEELPLPNCMPYNSFSAKNERILAAALATLPAQTQWILMERYWQNKSYREIGECLQTTEAYVRVRVLRAQRSLRDILKYEDGELSFHFGDQPLIRRRRPLRGRIARRIIIPVNQQIQGSI